MPYTVRFPWDGSVVAEVPDRPLQPALEAAVRASETMRSLSNAERSDLLLRALDLLRADTAAFAGVLCRETGKPIREARLEVERAQQTLLWSAIAARELCGEAVPIDGVPAGKGRMAMTLREPLGVIASITPFNVPLNLALHKVGPALAAGNAVVHKPAELTPLSAIRLEDLLRRAGLPEGAYNVVTGEDGARLGRALVADPRPRMITFTGSVEVGREIRASAGLRRVTLELGGNSPVIIEPDADLPLAVERLVQGSFANSGQLCISTQRVFVHESIADEFLEAFRAATERLVIGHPEDERTDISCLITEAEARRVEAWIGDAVSLGARVVTGGTRRGATVVPTILTDVPVEAKMSCAEMFGPVVGVNRYSETADAIRLANATPYGLQSGVFTRDLARAFDIARKLECGGVIVNDVPLFRADHMPYGGAKDSGLGREGPSHAIREMTEEKIVVWR